MGAAFYDNGIQPKTTSHYIHRVQRKLTISKIYSLSPLTYIYIYKIPSISARLSSHTARGNVPPFLLPSACPK